VDNRDVERFARCVRSHGVPNFPNPAVAPHAYKDAFSTQSAPFAAAYRTCGHLLPPGSQHHNQDSPQRTHAQVVALLAFAHCLRGHGYPSFPDPTTAGQLTREMLAKAGIDLHDTAVVRAADACTVVTHGVITRSVVANFVAGH
jgi:hypothetical protein